MAASAARERLARFEEGSQEWIDASREAMAGAEQTLHELDERTRSFVRERPMTALALAVATGFVVGRIASRW